MPVILGPIVRAALLLPQEIGALTDTLLGPFLHLVLCLQDVAIGRELPATADMRPCMLTTYRFWQGNQVKSFLPIRLASSRCGMPGPGCPFRNGSRQNGNSVLPPEPG